MNLKIDDYPYPRTVGNGRYEIAPNMYCNEGGLKEYFAEFKRTIGMDKKKYCFDYIKEQVDKWHPSVKENIKKQMLYNIPHYVNLPYIMPDRYIPATDYYGEVIDNIQEWSKQKEDYIENLYKEITKK